MSWKSIAGNQTVSRANLQNAIDTGVFIAKNGVPVTESNREITKANAQDYIYTWDLYPSFAAKTSNELPIKINLAVQSMQFFGTSDASYLRLYVGNNNRSWFCEIWSSNLNNVNDIAAIASSTDGSCITFGRYGPNNGSFFTSNTYGEDFDLRTDIIELGQAVTGVAMSYTGQYQIVTRQKSSSGGSLTMKIFKSSDYGITWSTVYDSAGVEYYVFGAAMSGDGTYSSVVACNYLGVYGTSYYVFHSSGGTYTQTFLCYGLPYNSGSGVCIDMSKSGQYQLAAPLSPTNGSGGSNLSIFFLSTDYGSTWTTINLVGQLTAITRFTGCTVSAGGDYMSVSATATGIGSFIFTSSDFGVTWTIAISSATSNPDSIAYVNSDRSGQFQYAYFEYSNLKYSNSYGQTPWNSLSLPSGSLKAISVNSTTYTTPYIYGVLNGVDYPVVSTDQGVTFSSLSSGIGVGDYNDIACSGGTNNGKYVVVISRNSSGYTYLFKSTDYGATFNTLMYYGLNYEFKRVAISDDGLHILAALYNSTTQRSTLLYSVDGGSFNAATMIGGLTYVDGEIKALCIAKISGGSGGFVVYRQSNNTSYVYRTTYTNSISDWTYTFYSSNTTKYNDMSCSGGGKYMTMVSRDNSDNAGRVFYSNDYGVNWTERLYSGSPDGRYSGLYCDNSSLSGVAIAGGIDYQNLTSKVWITKDCWANYSSYTLPFVIPLAGDKLAGINISSDATYWTLVVNNQYHTFTNSTGIYNNWTTNIIGSLLDFRRLSK